jgi:Na+/proline symporter
MNFTILDWTAIVGYLLITLVLGLYFRSRSGKSMDDYFLSGRSVSWWLAGTSMVATTFAADTPLVVTGLVYTQGISGNWLWWAFLLSGMMTVFLFTRLWRRSGLLTDVQFAEDALLGKPAAFLRGFRAIYLGMLMNCLILGLGHQSNDQYCRDHARRKRWPRPSHLPVLSDSIHRTLRRPGRLWGVLWTDLFQFVLKMSIVIAVAYFAVKACGGMGSLLSQLAAMRAAAGPNAGDATSFFPDFSKPFDTELLWTLPALTFVVNLGLQWWAFWYPGAEPGGGGYIAQRIFSAKDERHGVLSVLWFNVAHYAVRPWPWILTALSVIVLYPKLEHPESGYMMVVLSMFRRHYVASSLPDSWPHSCRPSQPN